MKRKFSISKAGSEESHGDRPWVFFMVDCFFLITEFFVLTFKFKAEESALPRQLPPGGPDPIPVTDRTIKHSIGVHVAANQNGGEYVVMGEPASAAKLEEILAASSSQMKDKVSVRVSYDSSVPWRDVMAVFNACTKVRIAECGLVPLRDAKVPQ